MKRLITILFLVFVNSFGVFSQSDCFEPIVRMSGRMSLFTSDGMNQASCNLTHVADTMGASIPLRIVGVDLYPLAWYQDPNNGYKKAYQDYLNEIESIPGGFLAFFITYGESSIPKVSLEMRVPEGGQFDEYTSLERLGISSVLSDSLESLVGRIDSDNTIKLTIEYASNLFSGITSGSYSLNDMGFELMENNLAIYSALTPIASQATNTDYTSQKVYDYSQLSVVGQPLATQVVTAKGQYLSFAPHTYITSNLNETALCAMEDAEVLFSSPTALFSLWVHVEYDAVGNYRIYGKSASNLTEEDAEAIVNAFYGSYMADYFDAAEDDVVAAKEEDIVGVHKSTQGRCQGDQFCTVLSAGVAAVWGDGLVWGKNISAYCCKVYPSPDEIDSDPAVALTNYYKGLGYGLVDGFVGTASALRILAGGVKEFKENNALFAPFWLDLFARGQQNGAWLTVSYQKAKESIEFAYEMVKFIGTIIISLPQVIGLIYTAIKDFVSDANPFTGLMRTGYSAGILAFEIIMELVTAGGGGIAKLGGSLARMSKNLLKELLNPMHYAELVIDLGRKLWIRLDNVILTIEQLVKRALYVSRTKNCFVAGTLVVMSGLPLDAKPIDQLVLFDLVQTESTANLPDNDHEKELLSGLISFEQISLDRKSISLDDPWYKADLITADNENQLAIARPLSWFKKHGFQIPGDEAWLELPEQGISHKMVLNELLVPVSQEEYRLLALDGEIQPVTAVVRHNAPRVLKVSTVEGGEIEVTPEHPLYSESEDAWVDAGALKAGDWLRTLQDSTLVVAIDTLFSDETTVYNLEVRKNHNFFVGEASVLAHNGYTGLGTRTLKNQLDNGIVIPKTPNEKALKRLTPEQFEDFLVELQHWGDVPGDYTRVRAWEALFPNQSFRTDPSLLQRMSDDISLEPAFADWIRQRPELLPGWRHRQGSYYSLGDPVRDVLGPGRLSDTEEWNRLISEMEQVGVEVIYSPPNMNYTPHWTPNTPGQVKIDPDASITALRHEHRHFLDDHNGGNWVTYEDNLSLDFRVTTEYNGYKLEMEAMRAIGEESTVSRIKALFQQEINELLDGFSITPSPSTAALIDELLNF